MYMYYLLAYRLVGLSEDEIWEDLQVRGASGGASEDLLYAKSSIFNRFPEDIIQKVCALVPPVGAGGGGAGSDTGFRKGRGPGNC